MTSEQQQRREMCKRGEDGEENWRQKIISEQITTNYFSS